MNVGIDRTCIENVDKLGRMPRIGAIAAAIACCRYDEDKSEKR